MPVVSDFRSAYGRFAISPSIEEGGGFRQFLLHALDLAVAFGSGLPGFIAFFLSASQERFVRFDGGRLSLQLRENGVQLHLPLFLPLSGFGQEHLFFLLRLLAQTGLGGADARIGLALPFFLASAQRGGPLLLRLGFTGVGADG